MDTDPEEQIDWDSVPRITEEEANRMAQNFMESLAPEKGSAPEPDPETLPGDPWYLPPPLDVCPIYLRSSYTPEEWAEDERESYEAMKKDRERYEDEPETPPGDPWYLPEKNLICPMEFRQFFTPAEWEEGARSETRPIPPGLTWLDYQMCLEPLDDDDDSLPSRMTDDRDRHR